MFVFKLAQIIRQFLRVFGQLFVKLRIVGKVAFFFGYLDLLLRDLIAKLLGFASQIGGRIGEEKLGG